MRKSKLSLRSMLASILCTGAVLAGTGSLQATDYDLFVHGLSTKDHCTWTKSGSGWSWSRANMFKDINNYWGGTAKPGPNTVFVGFNKNATGGAMSWQFPCGAQYALKDALSVFCSNNDRCRIYTHSTGGLVAAGLMAYLQDASLGSRYNIIQIRLMANASGGAELATDAPRIKAAFDTALIFHPLWRAALDKYVLPWLTNSEVMKSVRINPARQAFDHNKTTGRRLEITMGHKMNGEHGFTQPFLSGINDSTLSNHTLCGSRTVAPLSYCTGGNARVGRYQTQGIYYSKWDNYYALNMAINAGHKHSDSTGEWRN